jgi:hypothetical protein
MVAAEWPWLLLRRANDGPGPTRTLAAVGDVEQCSLNVSAVTAPAHRRRPDIEVLEFAKKL